MLNRIMILADMSYGFVYWLITKIISHFTICFYQITENSNSFYLCLVMFDMYLNIGKLKKKSLPSKYYIN